MRTVASFQWGGTSISARQLTVLKVYRMLGILKTKVLEFKIFRIKSLKIKIRRHAGATGASADISADARSEGRRKYRQRPPRRLKRGMFQPMVSLVLSRFAMALGPWPGAGPGRRLVLRVRLRGSGTSCLRDQTILPLATARGRPPEPAGLEPGARAELRAELVLGARLELAAGLELEPGRRLRPGLPGRPGRRWPETGRSTPRRTRPETPSSCCPT
jgi:hypothetical protein